MTPYFDEDGIVIYHGDCREVDAWLKADVLVTDPPYGTDGGNGYGRRQNHDPAGKVGQQIANDLDTTTRDAALALWGDRAAAVFASPRLPEPPGAWNDRLVWDKKRPGMNGGPWRYRHELIFVRGEWSRVSDRSVSVIEAFPTPCDHPHAKPLEVLSSLVAAAPSGVVADPFMGSGTTLRAAKDLGRSAIGIEVDERYCEIAAKRLAQGVLDFGAAS